MSDNTTFEDAINSLLALADKEEQSIIGDDSIDDDEKAVVSVLLSGYRKALSDLVRVLSEDEQ